MGILLSDWRSRLGIAIWGFFILLAITGPTFVEYVVRVDPYHIDFGALGTGPSATHWFGTSAGGKDVLAQTIYGARNSVIAGFGVGILMVTIVASLGIFSAYMGGRVDAMVNGMTNVFMTMAGFPLLLIVASYVAGTGMLGIVFVIALVSWPSGTRIVRSQALSIRNREFVTAMQLAGETRTRLVFFEIMPHMIPILAVQFLFGVLAGVFSEAALAFLGLAPGRVISWGTMIAEVQASGGLTQGMWWWFLPPGLCITSLGIAAGLINFAIDEFSNPRLRGMNPKAHKRALKTLDRMRKQAETADA